MPAMAAVQAKIRAAATGRVSIMLLACCCCIVHGNKCTTGLDAGAIAQSADRLKNC